MLNQISNTLRKFAKGWLVLLFFAGEMLFNAVILPAQQADIEAASGEPGRLTCSCFTRPRKYMPWSHLMGKQAGPIIAPSS
jgi:hypothetical protein